MPKRIKFHRYPGGSKRFTGDEVSRGYRMLEEDLDRTSIEETSKYRIIEQHKPIHPPGPPVREVPEKDYPYKDLPKGMGNFGPLTRRKTGRRA
jgi:hypothetical protein